MIYRRDWNDCSVDVNQMYFSIRLSSIDMQRLSQTKFSVPFGNATMGICGSKQIEYHNFGDLEHFDTSQEYWCFTEQHKIELEDHLQTYHLDILLPIIISYIHHIINPSWKYPNYHTFIHINLTPLNHNYHGIPLNWDHYRQFDEIETDDIDITINKRRKNKKWENVTTDDDLTNNNNEGSKSKSSNSKSTRSRSTHKQPSLSTDSQHVLKFLNIHSGQPDDVHYGLFKILMLGQDGVGKSSLTIRFVSNEFYDETVSNIVDNFEKLCALNVIKQNYDNYQHIKNIENELEEEEDLGINIQFNRYQIVDVSCDYEWGFTQQSDEYYKEAQIFLLVFDVMNNETFERIQIYRDEIINARKDIINDSYLIMIVGNKCDLRNNHAYIMDRRTNRHNKMCNMENVSRWINKYNLPYIETSAKENKNVHLLYRHCVYEYWIATESNRIKE